MNLAHYIDHTILKPTTTAADIQQLCTEAVEYNFAAVCVPPYWVLQAVAALQGTSVKTATVIGFPFGYAASQAKLAEVQQAIADGADELDIVINLCALKSGNWPYLESEMQTLMGPARLNNKIVKVIIESGILSNEEIIRCCEIYAALEVDFLKTSTGYAEKGATLEAVQLMRQHLPSTIQIKASGGIRTSRQAMEFIGAGATRLGCSASIAIVRDADDKGKNIY
jgi:deoxyribose-phosphate aldolase